MLNINSGGLDGGSGKLVDDENGSTSFKYWIRQVMLHLLLLVLATNSDVEDEELDDGERTEDEDEDDDSIMDGADDEARVDGGSIPLQLCLCPLRGKNLKVSHSGSCFLSLS